MDSVSAVSAPIVPLYGFCSFDDFDEFFALNNYICIYVTSCPDTVNRLLDAIQKTLQDKHEDLLR